jgi:hypothetical protein
MLELRREGKTFEEIGSEMGLVKQRVSEIFNSAIGLLQDVYADGESADAAPSDAA